MASRQSRSAGDDRVSIGALRAHLRGRPDDGAAWLAAAQWLAQHEPAGAELHHALEQAIRSLPENDAAWRLATAVKVREQGLDAALRWLERTLHHNPGLTAPLRVLADSHRQAGKWRTALAAYRRLEPLRSDDPSLLNDIGSCLASLEQFEAAEEYFQRTLRLQPDFTPAELNLALLCACRSAPDRALARLEAVLQHGTLDPATRRSATVMRDVLHEHRRLQPMLSEAVQSGDVSRLQRALAETPAGLCEPDRQTVAKMQSLARCCRGIDIDPQAFRYTSNTAALAFLEACTQCNLTGGFPEVVRIHAALEPPQPDPAALETYARLRGIWQVNLDRERHPAELLAGPDGEAWLRYWHARLLQDVPHKWPGQIKLAPNAIGRLPRTAPEQVAGTFRMMHSEILPGLPTGVGRGIFLFVAVNMIHGFTDGNGRLARFLLAWEAEGAGLPAILVPIEFRAEVARGIDAAWLDGALQPLVDVLLTAHAEVDRWLTRLAYADGSSPAPLEIHKHPPIA